MGISATRRILDELCYAFECLAVDYTGEAKSTLAQLRESLDEDPDFSIDDKDAIAEKVSAARAALVSGSDEDKWQARFQLTQVSRALWARLSRELALERAFDRRQGSLWPDQDCDPIHPSPGLPPPRLEPNTTVAAPAMPPAAVIAAEPALRGWARIRVLIGRAALAAVVAAVVLGGPVLALGYGHAERQNPRMVLMFFVIIAGAAGKWMLESATVSTDGDLGPFWSKRQRRIAVTALRWALIVVLSSSLGSCGATLVMKLITAPPSTSSYDDYDSGCYVSRYCD